MVECLRVRQASARASASVDGFANFFSCVILYMDFLEDIYIFQRFPKNCQLKLSCCVVGKPRSFSQCIIFFLYKSLAGKLQETANDRFCEKLCFLSRVQFPPVLVCTVHCTPVLCSVHMYSGQ